MIFFLLCIGLPSAETIPTVSVRSSPKGLPIAKTFCPTFKLPEAPNGIVRSFKPLGTSNFNTAKSFSLSKPTTTASN